MQTPRYYAERFVRGDDIINHNNFLEVITKIIV